MMAWLPAARCEGAGSVVASAGALSWSDEFDGAAGSSPDPTKWGFDVGGSGWGNHQLEFDTNRPTNASLDGNGHLVITAEKESYMGSTYTSARMTTKQQFTQAYGRFEARLKMPTGPGMWPAFWLLGANIDATPWPGCGEIDVVEYRGQEPTIAHGSVHGPGYSGGAAITQSYALPSAARLDADFHTYAVQWDPGRIAFELDGNVYETVTPANLGTKTWVFDHPFFIILNLAVGGDYVGPPSASTPFPGALVVDYVRVYAGGS
jgi:beta-glucanase (GH16 family)